MAAPDRPEYLKKLAALCADASLEKLGPAVVDRARWIIADSIPVIAAGMHIPEMKALVATHLKGSPAGAARRVAVIVDASKTGREIKISTIDGGLTLVGRSAEIGEINDEIDVSSTGGAAELGCNVAYLVDALAAFDGGPIHVRFSGGDPIVLTDPSDDTLLQVVMPTRV